jgi:signal transduction histidine kinase
MIDQNGMGKLAKLPLLLREAQDSVQDLEALLGVAKILHSTFEINDLFTLIVKQAIHLTGAERGCLLTVSSAQNNYQVEVAFDRSGAPILPLNFRISHTVIQEVISTRQPLNRDDIPAEDEKLSQQQSVAELGLQRVLCAPMIVNTDQVVGVIYVDSTEANQQSLSQRRLRTLDALAGHAATALHQAQLYQQINELYRITKVLEEAKSEFLNIASHELKTPLTLISGYAELLSTLLEADNETACSLISGISSGISRLTGTVNEMLYAAQIDQGNLVLNRQPYSIKVLVRQVVQKWQEAALSDRQLRFRTVFDVTDEDRLMREVDPIYLEIALGHLLQNSIKNTPDEGEISVCCSIKQRLNEVGSTLRLEVTDTGIGIETRHRDLVFLKFYRTTDSRLHSSGKTKFMGAGPGLGLYLVWGIVEAHGGKIWVEDNAEAPQSGTRMVIELPSQAGNEKREVRESPERIDTQNEPALLK